MNTALSSGLKTPLRSVTSIILCAHLLATTASAQGATSKSSFGIQLHVSEVDAHLNHNWDDTHTSLTAGQETGYGISASYYFDRSVSLRLTYEHASGFSSTSGIYDGTELTVFTSNDERSEHLSLVLMPQFDISPSLYGFAHAGIAHTRATSAEFARRYRDNSFVYGLGFGYRLTEQTSLSAEFSRTGSDYQALRLSLGYRF